MQGGMMRDLIRRPAGIVTAGLLAAVMVMVAAAPGAEAVSTGWTEVVAVVPANADTSQGATFGAVSCAAPGDCTAVGGYYDSSNNSQGLMLTETSGSWAPGVEAPLPANVTRGLSLDSVSCSSPGNCTAIGNYYDSSGNPQGLLLTETSGSWATGVEPVLPADAGTNTGASLSWVSCTAPGDCTAIGSYTDSSGDVQGLLLTETSGSWAAGVEAVLPADAGTNPSVYMNWVSCAAPGDCTAVGQYAASSGGYEGLLLTETAGSWAAGVQPVLPANASANAGSILGSVSCAAPGDCTAIGSYTDSSGNGQGLLLTETSGSWAAVEAVMPQNIGANPAISLRSVSCAAPGDCTAVGDVRTGNDTQGLLLTESSGTWAPGLVAPLPGPGGPGVTVHLFSVSCAAPGDCTAIGYFAGANGVPGVLLTQTSGTWTTTAPPLPPDGIADVFPQSVSCAAPGNCSAVGNDPTTSGHAGVLWNQTPTTQAATTTALASSANPSASGQAVTYTATISPAPDSGTVSFTDNGSPITGCSSQPVSTSTGQATCTTTPATTGAHNIVAAFSGSGSFAGSTSATLSQIVAKTHCQSLAGCNLSGLNLTNAQLSEANLSGANLNKTNLTGANLSGANLSGANLNGANLSGANLSGANLNGANLNKVIWSGTTCPDGTNSDADGGTCTGHL